MSKIADFVAGRTPPELYETYLAPGLFAPWAEELAALANGNDKCLDVACGTGIVSRALARRLKANKITAIDVGPLMISQARLCARNAGVSEQIEFHLASADALPFEDASFDFISCQQGFQFFPDKAKAMAEMRRVLKPGGALALSVWTAAKDGNPIFGAFEDAIARHLGEDLVPFGPFAFGDQSALAAFAEDAGLKIELIERRTKEATLPSIEEVVLFDVLFLGRPAADGALQPVLDPSDPHSDAAVEHIIADLETALKEYRQQDGRLIAPVTANFLYARA